MTRPQPTTSPSIAPPAGKRAGRGFTLTELLIVIGIIVLLIATAVPAFRAMSGGRSIDAAANTLAAVIGRARAEAIGSGRYAGVLFYLDPGTDRVGALVVRERMGPGNSQYAGAVSGTVTLDMTPGGEFALMPVGVGVQVLDDATYTGNAPNKVRQNDGYIGYNPLHYINPTSGNPGAALNGTKVGGVILFDGAGQLAVKLYNLAVKDDLSPVPGPNQLIKTLTGNPSVNPPNIVRVASNAEKNALVLPTSTIGLAVFDSAQFYEKFQDRASADGDPDPSPSVGSYAAGERAEEQWLDANAMQFLVNRFNGTLIRAE